MRISDWSSDVCSSDLDQAAGLPAGLVPAHALGMAGVQRRPWGEPARIPDQVVRHLGAGGAGAYPVDYAIASPCRSTRAGAPAPHAGPVCLLLHLPALIGLGVLGKRDRKSTRLNSSH